MEGCEVYRVPDELPDGLKAFSIPIAFGGPAGGLYGITFKPGCLLEVKPGPDFLDGTAVTVKYLSNEIEISVRWYITTLQDLVKKGYLEKPTTQ